MDSLAGFSPRSLAVIREILDRREGSEKINLRLLSLSGPFALDNGMAFHVQNSMEKLLDERKGNV